MGLYSARFLPIIIFGCYFSIQLYENMLADYSRNKQQLIKQADDSFNVSLEQVKSIHSLFQYNSEVNDYLSGFHLTEADQVYQYLKNIRPIFSFSYSSNEAIKSIRLYRTVESVIPVYDEVMSIEEFPHPEIITRMEQLKINQGMWLAMDKVGETGFPYLAYYQRVYNAGYTKQLAILELVVDDRILASFLKVANSNSHVTPRIARNGRSSSVKAHIMTMNG